MGLHLPSQCNPLRLIRRCAGTEEQQDCTQPPAQASRIHFSSFQAESLQLGGRDTQHGPGHSCYGCLGVAFIFAGGDASVRLHLHTSTAEAS